jgi:phosphate transport system substrate-binding protein
MVAHTAAAGPILTERERLRYGGSSTAFPFAFLVAQNLAQRSYIPLPIGEATGTSAGATLLCSGVGLLHPDIGLGSRPLNDKEKDRCRSHGVTEIRSLRFGLDTLAVVRKADMPAFALTRPLLWRALAATLPVNGRLVPNPYRRWRDIDPSLPDLPIRVIGPAATSGKIDTLENAVMEESCRSQPEIAAISDPAERRRICVTLRTDGAYIPHTLLNLDYAERLLRHPGPALALVKVAELTNYAGQIVAVPVEGALPTAEALRSGRYPIVRSLYMHLKMDHAALVPGMKVFAEEFFRDEAGGTQGYLTHAGMVPLTDEERGTARQTLEQLFKGRQP